MSRDPYEALQWCCHAPEQTVKGLLHFSEISVGTLKAMFARHWARGRERFLEVSDDKATVSVRIDAGETMLEALQRARDELADPDTVFDDADEEALARLVVPRAVAELERGSS